MDKAVKISPSLLYNISQPLVKPQNQKNGDLTCLICAAVNHDPRVDKGLRAQDFRGDMSGLIAPLLCQ